MRKTVRRTSSSDDIRLKAPTAWEQLSQPQLRYVLELLSLYPKDLEKVKTYMFVRFCNLKVMGRCREGWRFYSRNDKRLFFLSNLEVSSLLVNFDFVGSYEDMNVRLESVLGLKAVDIYLRDVAFVDYLNAEKAFQSYLQSNSREQLLKLLRILYRPVPCRFSGVRLRHTDIYTRATDADLLAVFVWYAFVIKTALKEAFPDLFRPASSVDASSMSIVDGINAQIRALTGGDVTKEKDVMGMLCWRALTELNAKARDAQEMQRIMQQNKSV